MSTAGRNADFTPGDGSVHAVIEDVTRRRQAGEDVEDEAVIASRPDLAPQLEIQLQYLRRVEQAQRLASGAPTSAPQPDYAPATPARVLLDRWQPSLPGYELRREIHRGGQGVVFEAIQTATRRPVAVKVLREGPLATEADDARFEREAQILGQLRHPNIVAVHDGGVVAGRRYLVMDYVPGCPLDAYVEAERLSIPETLRLFAKVCQAVNIAHLRGVIHRDLKPANILVDPSGEPRVLDFGLARLSEFDALAEASPHATLTGQFVGSLPFASPEQAASRSAEIDVRTDVYALGVTLYKLLTGKFPYSVTGSIRDVMDQILAAAPIRPRTLRPQIPDEVETILLKCLDKAPERRYQSAGDLARDLERYLAGEPIEARRDSGWYVLRKQLWRHRAAVSVGGALLLVILAALVVSLAFWRQAVRQRDLAVFAADDAERRLELAREGADLMLYGICRELPRVVGTRELQRELLEKASAHYEKLAHETPGQLDQRRGVWMSFRELGDAYLALSDFERAAAALSRFNELAAAAAGAEPDAEQYQADVFQSHIALGDAALRTDDYEKAQDHYQQALEFARRAAEQWSDPERATGLLSVAWGALARWRLSQFESVGGDNPFAQKLRLDQAYFEAHPEDPAARKRLFDAHFLLGQAAEQRRQWRTAREQFEAALALGAGMTSGGADSRVELDLVETRIRLANVAGYMDDSETEGRLLQAALPALKRLVEAEPSNPEYLAALSNLHVDLGDWALWTRQFELARDSFTSALGVDERLADAEPDSLRRIDKLAIDYERLGRLADTLGAVEDAVHWREQRLGILRRLRGADPGSPRYRFNEAGALVDLAELLARNARDDAAAERFREAFDRLEALAAETDDWRAHLLLAQLWLQCEVEALRDPAKGLAAARAANRRTRELRADCLALLALALFETGDRLSAVATQTRAIERLPAEDEMSRRAYEATLGRYQRAAGERRRRRRRLARARFGGAT